MTKHGFHVKCSPPPLAIWDHLDRRLVVLAGRYQFGISLEVYEDLEANIELAWPIALRVMEQF